MKLPRRPLTNMDLEKNIILLNIPYFRGVYMRNRLPAKIRKMECGIVNLDDYLGQGTHWTAYIKHMRKIKYFDSIGNLKPPRELVTYFQSDGNRNEIQYNHKRYQAFNSYNCGHLCLKFLYSNIS